MSERNKILLIDDEVDFVKMLSFQLEASKYDVTTAEDGLEGLEKLEEMTPDLIVLDINMPKMGGLEFYNKICDETGKPGIPVLILTARANLEKMFNDLDVNGFMTKPFEIEDLLDNINLILKEQDQSVDILEKARRETRKVLIVEDDQSELGKISLELLNEGFTVTAVSSGAEAVEKLQNDKCDVLLINKRLKNLPGDQVLFKLKRMPSAMKMKYILYNPSGADIDDTILDNFRKQVGENLYLNTSDPRRIVDAIEDMYSSK